MSSSRGTTSSRQETGVGGRAAGNRTNMPSRISLQPGAVPNSVPLLRKKQCRRNAPTLLALRQAVAHISGKCGLVLLLLLAAGVGLCRAAGEDDLLETRRQRIKALTPAELQQLLHLKERFDKLAPEEQQRLRRLHEGLDRDPDADTLRPLMQRYHEWLLSLSPLVRAELLELENVERIQRIKKMLAEEERTIRPNLKDIEAVRRWIEEYVRKQGLRLLTAMPEHRQQEILRMPESTRRRMVAWEIWQRWQSSKSSNWPPFSDADLAALHKGLSENTRERLAARTPDEQRRIIGGWVRQARHSFGSRHFSAPLPPVDEKQLSLFFENELTDQQRDRLLSLPGDEMQGTLRKMYLEQNRTTRSPSYHPGGSSHGKRPSTSGKIHRPSQHDHPNTPEKPTSPKSPPSRPDSAATGQREPQAQGLLIMGGSQVHR